VSSPPASAATDSAPGKGEQLGHLRSGLGGILVPLHQQRFGLPLAAVALGEQGAGGVPGGRRRTGRSRGAPRPAYIPVRAVMRPLATAAWRAA